MHLADPLFRAYLPNTAHPTATEFENINAATFLPIFTTRLREIQQATEVDEVLRPLKNTILRRWPEERNQVPTQVAPYFHVRDEFSIQDGVIYHGQ
jgi:hypothetical protein